MQSDIIGLQSFGDIQSQSKSTMSFDYDYTVPAVEVVQPPLKKAPQLGDNDFFNAKMHANNNIVEDAMSDVTTNTNTTTGGGDGLLHDLDWLNLLDRSVYLDASFLRLRCLIGRGAFGVVYSAEYKGQPVAVKMVKLAPTGSSNAASRGSTTTTTSAEADTPYAFTCSLGDSALLQSLPAHIQPLSQLIQEILVLNYLRSVQVPGAQNHVIEFIGCTYSHDTLMLVTKLCAYGSVESCLVAKSTAPAAANPRKIPRPIALSQPSYSPSLALQIRILFQAALGLHQVHSAKVVHHDIAARNLLLDNQWNCFLADYGLAHYQMQGAGSEGGDSTMQTQPQRKNDLSMLRAVSEPMNVDSMGSPSNAAAKSLPNSLSSLKALRLLPRASPVSELVSVRHASPESIRGVVGSHSYPSDIWSFAITAWEVLAGAVPYAELHNFQVGYRVVEEQYRLPLNAHWPHELQGLLRACWNTAPESRPTSMDLTEVLERLVSQVASDPKLRSSAENPFAIPVRNETMEAAMSLTRKPSIAKKKSLGKSVGAAIPKVVSVIDAYDRPITPTEHFDVPEDTYMQTDPSPAPAPAAPVIMGPPKPVLKKSALLAPSRVRPIPTPAAQAPVGAPVVLMDEGPALGGVKLKQKEEKQKIVARADQDLLDPFADFADTPIATPQQQMQQQQQQQQQQQEQQVHYRKVALDQLNMFNSLIAVSTPAPAAPEPKPSSGEVDSLFNLPAISPDKVQHLFDMQTPQQPVYPQPIIPQPIPPQVSQAMPPASRIGQPATGAPMDLLGFVAPTPTSAPTVFGGTPSAIPPSAPVTPSYPMPMMPVPIAPMPSAPSFFSIPPPPPPQAPAGGGFAYGARPGAPPAAPPAKVPMPAAAQMLNFPPIQGGYGGQAYGGLPAQAPGAPPAANRLSYHSNASDGAPMESFTEVAKKMSSVRKPAAAPSSEHERFKVSDRDQTRSGSLSDLTRKSELLSKEAASFTKQAKGPAASFSLFAPSTTPTSSSSSSSSSSNAAPSSDKQRARSRSGGREERASPYGRRGLDERGSKDESRSFDRSDRGGGGGRAVGAGYGFPSNTRGEGRGGSAGGRGGRGGGAVLARNRVVHEPPAAPVPTSPANTAMDWRSSSLLASSASSTSSSTLSPPKDAPKKKKSFTQTMTEFFSNTFSRKKQASETAPAEAVSASTGSAISNAPAAAPVARVPASIAQHAAAVAAAAASPSQPASKARRRVSVTDSLAVEKVASKRKSKVTTTIPAPAKPVSSLKKSEVATTTTTRSTRGREKAVALSGKRMDKSESESASSDSSRSVGESMGVSQDEFDEEAEEYEDLEGGMDDDDEAVVVVDAKTAKKRKRATEAKKVKDVDLLAFDGDIPEPQPSTEAQEDAFASFAENEAVNEFDFAGDQRAQQQSPRQQKQEMELGDLFALKQEPLGSTIEESPFSLTQDLRKHLKSSTAATSPTIRLSQLRNVRHFNSDVFEAEMNINGAWVAVLGRAFQDNDEYLTLKRAATSVNANTNRILPVAGFIDAVATAEEQEEEESQPNYILMRKELFVSPDSGTSSTLQAAFNSSFPPSSSGNLANNPAFPDSDRLRWFVSAWKQYATAISQLQSLRISFGAGGAVQIPSTETTARMIEQPDVHLPLSPQLLLFPSSHPHLFDSSATFTSEELIARSEELSARYLAPELIRGSLGQADEKAEVWSIAVTIWELVTGLVAYEQEQSSQSNQRGGGINALLLRIATGAARLQIQGQVSLSALPASFQNLLEQCLEINPANRPTLAKLMQGLEQMKV